MLKNQVYKTFTFCKGKDVKLKHQQLLKHIIRVYTKTRKHDCAMKIDTGLYKLGFVSSLYYIVLLLQSHKKLVELKYSTAI